MNELVKVDPKQFGLEEIQVSEIEKAFLPKIAERDGYAIIYEQLITKELTVETCAEASSLRKKLVKTRTGIADVHKTQKAFFLSAGKFVDAWKNKETLPVEQMEEKLAEIEKHFEKIESDRIVKLETERNEEIGKYSEVVPSGLGIMDNSVYQSYLTGCKVAYDARIKFEAEAEAERLRLEEVEKLNTERKNKTIRLVEYIDNYENLPLGEMTEPEFMVIVNTAIKKRTEHEAEQERVRKENEQLKAEADRKAKEVEVYQKKVEAKREEDKKHERIYREKQDAILAKEREEFRAKQDALEAKAKKERNEAEAYRKRVENERKEKQEADQKAKELSDKIESDRIAAKEKADKLANQAPDKDKLTRMINEMVFVNGDFRTPESQAVYNVINQKFEGFKSWAINQIKSL